MKNIILISIFYLIFYFNIQAQSSKEDTLINLANYVFTDFKGQTYKVSDFKDKYFFVMQITPDADTSMFLKALKYYDKIASEYPNRIFINVIWSNDEKYNLLSSDNNFGKWLKAAKSYNIKSKNVICLYEDKTKNKIGFSTTRLSEYFVFYMFYIDKEGREVKNRINNWSKETTKENIEEFKKMENFFSNFTNKINYQPRR